MTAREDILARIGGNFASSPVGRSAPDASRRSRDDIVEQFAEYTAEYRATVLRVSASEVANAVAERLAERGSAQLVVPGDIPASWLPVGVEVVRDDGLSHDALDQIPSVLTGCRLGIAETGTIVLDAGPRQGRRAISLLPDHHICVVQEDEIVDSVEEAVALLFEAVRDGRPLTWISGPSATSDIELSRVEGVHGPRNLDVLVVAADENASVWIS